MTEDELVGWHHQLNGHEFEQTQGDGEGEGSLACCSSWGHKNNLVTEQQQSEMVDVEVSLNMIVKWVNFEQEFGKRN